MSAPRVWRRFQVAGVCSLCKGPAEAAVCFQVSATHHLALCSGCVGRMSRVARTISTPTLAELAAGGGA